MGTLLNSKIFQLFTGGLGHMLFGLSARDGCEEQVSDHMEFVKSRSLITHHLDVLPGTGVKSRYNFPFFKALVFLTDGLTHRVVRKQVSDHTSSVDRKCECFEARLAAAMEELCSMALACVIGCDNFIKILQLLQGCNHWIDQHPTEGHNMEGREGVSVNAALLGCLVQLRRTAEGSSRNKIRALKFLKNILRKTPNSIPGIPNSTKAIKAITLLWTYDGLHKQNEIWILELCVSCLMKLHPCNSSQHQARGVALSIAR